MNDKNIPVYFDVGAIARTPAEIAADPTLSNARKIELLKSLKERHVAPEDKGMLGDADLELDKLLELNALANDH
ncbi:hypothetical protein [Pelagibacterium halotolerans]|uniref:Uncharacterized protein n=1 Tax=Pelagibacterium halotolerans (strain DSM 22347 / JCM 15775 / CGMCC 1.7692 / B2) TaxID=1082931 RepID=G4RG52_PELHB|nr:hypothetical protein [Pelagibacterium halotolerans]AEQ52066.1 hypothetical protein KKY_2056 [Pelagibacterium halotolerans B2]QJR18158.1 hypothetical protein HKM20_06740 [Pelagibacterium halotolerans]SDZ82722.1 hypothetical protein SAMN05428936_101128 [Pelagibacterium halotolerans]